MAGEVAVDDVGGVGVGVEVDDADVAVAVHVGDGGGGRPGDRVVAAEDDRHDAAEATWCDPLADVGVAHLGLPVGAVGVAVVDDLEVVEDLEVEVDVVGAGLVGLRCGSPAGRSGRPGRFVVAMSNGAPTMATSGCQLVELFGIGEERALAERGQPAEHVAELELLVHPGGEVTAWLAHRGVP